MDTVTALKHVLEDSGYSEEERNSAREILRDLATSAETSFERESARRVLDDSDPEKPPSPDLLRCLELMSMTPEEWKSACQK